MQITLPVGGFFVDNSGPPMFLQQAMTCSAKPTTVILNNVVRSFVDSILRAVSHSHSAAPLCGVCVWSFGGVYARG